MADVIYTDSETLATVETSDGVVSVVLSESVSGSTVTTTAPNSVEHITETAEPTVIVSPVESVSVINSIETGPQGVDALAANPGTTEGDILRWNTTTEAWEVKSEPFEFGQIVLTPALAALADIEGGLWYDSATKSVMVCTSDT